MAESKKTRAERNRENGKKGGRPPGTKNAATIEREAALRLYRERVAAKTRELLDAQLLLALGQSFVFRVDKKRIVGPKGGVSYQNERPVVVTDPDEIAGYLERREAGDTEPSEGEPYYYITAKEPSREAIKDVLEMTYGKAPQPLSNDESGALVLKTIVVNKNGGNGNHQSAS